MFQGVVHTVTYHHIVASRSRLASVALNLSVTLTSNTDISQDLEVPVEKEEVCSCSLSLRKLAYMRPIENKASHLKLSDCSIAQRRIILKNYIAFENTLDATKIKVGSP